VRELGNLAAHPNTDTAGVILEIEPHEAELMLDAIEDLFDFFWVCADEGARQTGCAHTQA
jgi:hypothetical protein